MPMCLKRVMSKLYTWYVPGFITYKSKYGEKKVSMLLRKAAAASLFICVYLVLLVMSLFGVDIAIKEYLRTYKTYSQIVDFVKAYTYPLKHDIDILLNVLITAMTSCGLLLFYVWSMMQLSVTRCCSRIGCATYKQLFGILFAVFTVYKVFALMLVGTYHFSHHGELNHFNYRCTLLIYAIFHSILMNFISVHYAIVNFQTCKKVQIFTAYLSVMSGIAQVGIVYGFLPLDLMIMNLYYVMLAFIFPCWMLSRP